MIKLLQKGSYSLSETKNQTKILILDGKQAFAWVNLEEIGEILVSSHVDHVTDTKLAMGEYCLYDVKDEPEYIDLQHLELAVGLETWQGYLLPTGLPDESDKRNRIIPTEEVITGTL